MKIKNKIAIQIRCIHILYLSLIWGQGVYLWAHWYANACCTSADERRGGLRGLRCGKVLVLPFKRAYLAVAVLTVLLHSNPYRDHAALILCGGRLMVFGSNAFGQLGIVGVSEVPEPRLVCN